MWNVKWHTLLGITSAAVEVRDATERVPANREKVKGEKVSESACRLRLFNESITPNFLAETGIHQSASNAGSTAKMKESLEAVAEGRKTHVRTLLNEFTHACATVRKTEKRRRYRDMCVCVCVCVCVSVCVSLHIIACWVRVD